MKLLLDTHTFLWWVAASKELSRKARSAIGSGRNECFVSVASGWEIAIKVSLGKLRIEGALDRFLPEQLAVNGFQPLPIDLKHAARVATLPFHLATGFAWTMQHTSCAIPESVRVRPSSEELASYCAPCSPISPMARASRKSSRTSLL
jgi:PIN domain nuclease of toxin-antitoxin system